MVAAAMVKPSKVKASRITTACNPCRSRKQKCSGRRPNCEQCTEYNRTCEWPEQLKRGPAKGYVEALEQRLHETEDVLLKVVSQLNQAQLASMLSSQTPFPTDDDSQDKNKSSRITLLPSRKLGVEYWKSFPLRDAESIQRWQQDCYLNRSNVSPNRHIEDDNILSQPVRAEQTRGNINVDCPSADNRQSYQSLRDDLFSMKVGRDQDPAPLDGNDLGYRPLRLRKNHIQSSRKQDESNISQLSTWKAAPSKEFQQQFLW